MINFHFYSWRALASLLVPMRVILALLMFALLVGHPDVLATRETPPRPNLQGTWNGSTKTPLERPPAFRDKATFTREEAAEYVRRSEDRARDRLPTSSDRLTQADVHDP